MGAAVDHLVRRLTAAGYRLAEAKCLAQTACLPEAERSPEVPPALLTPVVAAQALHRTLAILEDDAPEEEAFAIRALMWELFFGRGTWPGPFDTEELYAAGVAQPPPPPPAPPEKGTRLVFSSPPGWPRFRPGWVPPPGWTPDPRWPQPPPGWAFMVERDKLVLPSDLSADFDPGHPSEVDLADVASVARSAADTIAWRLCERAAIEKVRPLALFVESHDAVEQAVQAAHERVFRRLLDRCQAWLEATADDPEGHAAALVRSTMILAASHSFSEFSMDRILEVLTVESSGDRKPPSWPAGHDTPPPAPASPPTSSPVAAATQESPASEARWMPIMAIAFAVVILIIGGAILASQTGRDGKLPGSLESAGWARGDGGIYWQWVTSSAPCSNGSKCSIVRVQPVTDAGCNAGVRVTLDVLAGGKTVTSTYQADIRPLPKGTSRDVEVGVAWANADNVRMNKVECLN